MNKSSRNRGIKFVRNRNIHYLYMSFAIKWYIYIYHPRSPKRKSWTLLINKSEPANIESLLKKKITFRTKTSLTITSTTVSSSNNSYIYIYISKSSSPLRTHGILFVDGFCSKAGIKKRRERNVSKGRVKGRGGKVKNFCHQERQVCVDATHTHTHTNSCARIDLDTHSRTHTYFLPMCNTPNKTWCVDIPMYVCSTTELPRHVL